VEAWAFRRRAACVFELRDLAMVARSQAGVCLPMEYTFRQATPEELPACAELADTPLDEYRRRCHDGDQCYVTFCGEEPVNLNWLHFGPCYVYGLGLLIEAGPSECYLYNVLTHPRQRGKGLYKNTQRILIETLASRGIARVRQVVAVDNIVPQLALPKLGYELTQVIRHRCIGGLKITTILDAGGAVASRRLFWRTPAGVFRI
jgi:ribosomal protein S18 acetylase RimI-like enzyme